LFGGHHNIPVVFTKIVVVVAVGVCLTFEATALAQAPHISLELLETSPASPAILHNGERLYLRIRYDADQPMRMVVRYSARGERIKRGQTNGEALLEPGQGEAVAWVSFTGAEAVDAVDLSASSNGRDGFAAQHLSVDYRWDSQRSAGETPASWVGPLLAEQERRQKAAFAETERRLSTTGSGGLGAVSIGISSLLVFLVLPAVVAGFVWPIWGAVRWKGGWRTAAMVPLALAALWALKDAYDLAVDPTSHNLLPLEFGLGALIVAPYMLVVTIVRRIRRRAALSGPLRRG
jgi:hypothetical protein